MAGQVSIGWDPNGNLIIYLDDQEAVDWFDEEIYYVEKDPDASIYNHEWPDSIIAAPRAHHKSPDRKFISPKLKDGDVPSKGIKIVERMRTKSNSPPMNKVCPCKLNPNASCE